MDNPIPSTNESLVAQSNITLANAAGLVCEVVRNSVGNDSADPDANKDVLPLGMEDAVLARINARLANRSVDKTTR